jgi:hypothetical protein
VTPEERRKLIDAPLVIEHIGGRGWGGASYAHIGLGLRSRSRSVYYDTNDPNTPERETPDADHFPR